MPSWNGKTLGKVQVGELIARGGMAEVYLGEHTTLNRKVAVKIMRDHVDSDPDNHVRFEREARVVAGLRHPNIIQVYDYELVDGQPCLIMELVTGASMGNYLKALHKRGEKLPLETVALILSKLSSAVDYAHNQNIIHRDIKPANVLLRSPSSPIDLNKPLPADVEPILTDFGLVRLLDSSIQTSTGTVSGTPAYMSPEQARGEKVNSKTDIYSLGVMLYEMLAGVVPFDAESSFGILMKHLNDPPPPIFGISSDLQAIINRALSKDPELRYDSAKAMADEFLAVFNGQTISADTARIAKIPQRVVKPAAEAAAEGKKSTRNNPTLMWVGVALGVVAITALGLVFFKPQTPQATPAPEATLPPPTPTVDPNEILGRVVFTDQNGLMDKAALSFDDLPIPEEGTHYDVWFLGQGGEFVRKAGSITKESLAQGQLVYTNPEQNNVLSLFDQIEITLEVDNDPNPDTSSGNVVASSVFPPMSLIHVRHVVVSFVTAPEGVALIQGLWGATESLNTTTTELGEAYKAGDETLTRQKLEEIANLIAGNANTVQYIDWDGDGVVSDSGDGFGLLQNGEPGYTDQGYIAQSISHAQFAARAPDSTANIKLQSANVVICLQNMQGWTEQVLEKVLRLQEMPFGPEMEPIITEILTLSDQIISGVDSNNNQLIEPIVGEGGATTAYEYAYYMAEMPLLLGIHRVPPPAPTPGP
ncbi:MAG TPA: serine/threonine-protein kinase [Anaerolineales bacterium]|nr:serine/threonine-protein kinase [Anaerolineales bacterium]HNH78853.1 serine/threonine-protein kinase [Anaerolineales bacterium]